MKQLSSMMVGIRLQRFEHAADADAAGQVNVLADLRARADGGPGVDHRALVDVGADVDVGRHQHDVLRDEAAAPRDGGRNDAHAGGAHVLGVEVRELRLHLVVEAKLAGMDRHVVVEPERQQHGLLEPLVRDPRAVDLLGYAQAPGVEVGDGMIHGVAYGRGCGGR